MQRRHSAPDRSSVGGGGTPLPREEPSPKNPRARARLTHRLTFIAMAAAQEPSRPNPLPRARLTHRLTFIATAAAQEGSGSSGFGDLLEDGCEDGLAVGEHSIVSSVGAAHASSHLHRHCRCARGRLSAGPRRRRITARGTCPLQVLKAQGLGGAPKRLAARPRSPPDRLRKTYRGWGRWLLPAQGTRAKWGHALEPQPDSTLPAPEQTLPHGHLGDRLLPHGSNAEADRVAHRRPFCVRSLR